MKYETSLLVDLHQSLSGLVEKLKTEHDLLELDLEHEYEANAILLNFIKANSISLEHLVNFAYQTNPEFAKYAVGSLHDETIDLSKIPASSADFEPWNENN